MSVFIPDLLLWNVNALSDACWECIVKCSERSRRCPRKHTTFELKNPPNPQKHSHPRLINSGQGGTRTQVHQSKGAITKTQEPSGKIRTPKTNTSNKANIEEWTRTHWIKPVFKGGCRTKSTQGGFCLENTPQNCKRGSARVNIVQKILHLCCSVLATGHYWIFKGHSFCRLWSAFATPCYSRMSTSNTKVTKGLPEASDCTNKGSNAALEARHTTERNGMLHTWELQIS